MTPVVGAGHAVGPEVALDADDAFGHEVVDGRAEAAALGQFVVGAAADESGGVGSAQQPGDGGCGFGGGEPGEVEEDVGCGVAAAGDGDALAGEALSVGAGTSGMP